MLDEKIKEAGSSELKREKVEKSMTKDKFLDILKSADSKPEKVTKNIQMSVDLTVFIIL